MMLPQSVHDLTQEDKNVVNRELMLFSGGSDSRHILLNTG